MIALEGKTSEPGRYKNRGGQLLKEEKERKSIAKKLPEIEEILKKLLLEYEIEYKRKFTSFGNDVSEIIDLEWQERRLQKEKLMSARKISTPSRKLNITRTPHYHVSTRATPSSLRNLYV